MMTLLMNSTTKSKFLSLRNLQEELNTAMKVDIPVLLSFGLFNMNAALIQTKKWKS